MSSDGPSFQLALNSTPVRSRQLSPANKPRSKMSLSPSNLGYFLCEQVSPIQATLPAQSEWSVWQNESCTLASRSEDECACLREGDDGGDEDESSGVWRWRWCTVQIPEGAAVMVEMTHCEREECEGTKAICEWPRRRLIVVPLTPELIAAIPSLASISPTTRSELSGPKAPSVAPCVPTTAVHRTPSALPLAFARSTEVSDAGLVVANNRFSSPALSPAYSTPSAVFSTSASSRAPFIPTRALPLVDTPPRSRLLPVATDALPISPKRRLLKPVTANAFAEVSDMSPSPLHPVSSTPSPLYDSSSPFSYHSFNIPLSDSPDSTADYNQHYSPYDKPVYEKEFSDYELDQDIIDEFLIPDRQSLFLLDSPLQFDAQPVSPFFSFIDEIIDEVRDEIQTEKASPSPSDPLAESISLIAHSDIDAKLKIVTSSGCSDKAYKVTIEPVKKSRKRLAPPPPPPFSGVKKERIDISKLTREEAAERKRYQNRVAAQRYRAKIREEKDSEFSECVFLEDRNALLREQEEVLTAEIAKYKALLLDRAACQ